jgi:hypothetical protein
MKRYLFIGSVVSVVVLAVLWINYDRELNKPKSETLVLPHSPRPITGLIQEPKKNTSNESVIKETIKQLSQKGLPSLTNQQIQGYLTSNDRDATSLVIGSRLSKNPELLREAVTRFGDNPVVQLEMALRGPTPEERQAALDAFKTHDPQNSLCDYLDSLSAFERGDFSKAAGGLIQSLDSGTLQDYSLVLASGTEAAYLSAGYNSTEAQLYALFDSAQRNQDTTGKMGAVADKLGELRDQYIKNNDMEAAEPTVTIGLDIGQKIQSQGNPSFLSSLVGIDIEAKILNQLDPSTPINSVGQTTEARLTELNQQKNLLQTLVQKAQDLPISKMSDEQMKDYTQRLRSQGEVNATQWWIDQNK